MSLIRLKTVVKTVTALARLLATSGWSGEPAAVMAVHSSSLIALLVMVAKGCGTWPAACIIWA